MLTAQSVVTQALLLQAPVCSPDLRSGNDWLGLYVGFGVKSELCLGDRWGPLKSRKTSKELRLARLHGTGRYFCKNQTQGQEIKQKTCLNSAVFGHCLGPGEV